MAHEVLPHVVDVASSEASWDVRRMMWRLAVLSELYVMYIFLHLFVGVACIYLLL